MLFRSLVGRLGLEVGQGRWRQLTLEEQQRLGSLERWTTSLGQLAITSGAMAQRGGSSLSTLLARLRPAAQEAGEDGGPKPAAQTAAAGKRKGKRWVRPESPLDAALEPAAPGEASLAAEAPVTAVEGTTTAHAADSTASVEAAVAVDGAPDAPDPAPGAAPESGSGQIGRAHV